jgi:ABC-type multidrug transport system ATPase subunit
VRLATIYIPANKLTHLFGEAHNGITLNLGGKYFYKFNESENSIKLVEKTENKNFIKSFWGEGISLISAIVGANGTGKTSILRTLIQELNSNPKLRNCILIYEKEDIIQILNETNLILEKSKIKHSSISKSDTSESILYYSPNLDYDLQEINSSISLVDYHRNDLQSYYIGNIRRHLFFLKNKNLIEILKENYIDFPSYNKIRIKAKVLYKSDFEKIYIQSTLGNKLFKMRNFLLDRVDRSLDKTISLNSKDIEDLFNNTDSIQDELKALWNKYNFKDENNSQYLHNGRDFFKNIEVNILTYLILKDTFSLDGDYGSYSFNKILNAKLFTEKLTHFLNKFIIQTSEIAYNFLKRRNIKIDVDNFNLLKDEINKFSNSGMTYRGISDKKKGINVIKQIELIETVYNFYVSLTSITKSKYCSKIEGGFEFDVKNSDVLLLDELLNYYEGLISEIKIDKLNSILEIKPFKKLSTGEKSLLDLYSSIYDYLKRWVKTPYMYSDNCILLLDEPEQGYHPLWKKKFIQAITSTLPKVFQINPIIKSLQIIFTTHDPLTLSDIPSNNIVYLEKIKIDHNYTTKVISKNEKLIKKSFGAIINDLLSDSFFIEGNLIGDFAKEKIEETIKWINKAKHFPTDIPIDKYNYYKKIISIIDEPIIRTKLSEMIEELTGNNTEFQKNMLQKEINYLQSKKDNL